MRNYADSPPRSPLGCLPGSRTIEMSMGCYNSQRYPPLDYDEEGNAYFFRLFPPSYGPAHRVLAIAPLAWVAHDRAFVSLFIAA